MAKKLRHFVRHHRRWCVAWPAVAVIAASAIARGDEEKPVRFKQDIQPIFRAHCIKCHGDEESQSGLNLATAESISQGSDEAAVIVDGPAETSLLFQKLTTKEMPPADANDPLSEAEIDVIRRWLNAGAPGVQLDAPRQGRTVTDKDREFWAFRPPQAAPIPEVLNRDQVRTSIDSFLLARLESHGLSFSHDSEKSTLLRRAYLDLIGLPPPPEAVEEFLADDHPEAYERLLEQLLDSPQYGERWGRHWLDVAGYTDSPHWNADSTGAMQDNEDWLYRDYVVQAFNSDKPYDRFLSEQLAGDELVDWRSAESFTPEILEPLIATGYLRTTPDWTHTDGLTAYRFDTLARVVDNVSTGLFGLTMGCARCHSHKFDPIPQEDYYRLMAVFAAAYNTENWLRPVDRFLPNISPKEKEALDRHNADLEARAKEIRESRDQLRAPYRQKILADKLATLPEVLRTDVEAALKTTAPMRSEIQRYLAQKFESQLSISDQELANSLSEAERAQVSQWETEIASLLKLKRSFRRIQALFDVGKPPALRQLIRGDARTPGRIVNAGFPQILSQPNQPVLSGSDQTDAPSSGRRLALARWLTDRNHPLTSRVMVNRIWQHHFGKGIVATPENFGLSGALPTHPELLDWLAADFMEHGWQIKRLHRQIMLSTAYRQSCRRQSDHPALRVDPENELLWRMNLRRMEAEVVRDSVLAVSGKLNSTMSGPPVPVESNADGLVTVSQKGLAGGNLRRSLYIRSLRGSHPGGQGFKLSMLEIFDFPEIVINCTRRTNSATPLQSLAFLNSQFMIEQASYFAERIASAPAGRQIESAFLLALARKPSDVEAQFCAEFLRVQAEVYLNEGSPPPRSAEQALASLCSMLLASNEFLYLE